MTAFTRQIRCDSAPKAKSAWQGGCKGAWWFQGREASLNWLALGVLLAAWNASDNDTAAQVRRRPAALRGYSTVSVRAATVNAEQLRTAPTL